MQTGLSGARWTIQVVVDGLNTANQTARGSAAFLSGFLLSYSSYHDVSFIVSVDGTVPQAAGPQVMLLQVEEIDNSNQLVPGSVMVITVPVAGQPETTGPAPSPTFTPAPPRRPSRLHPRPDSLFLQRLPDWASGSSFSCAGHESVRFRPFWPRVRMRHNLHLVLPSTLSVCLKALAEVSSW